VTKEATIVKPQFIGIGAARAGTTWIFKQLDQHPDVWTPRIKELHYFTRSTAYSGPSHLSVEGRMPRLLGVGPGPNKYRTHFFRAVGSNILRPSMAKLRWDAKYFFERPNDDWYRSLFEDAGDKIAGEITPRYSILTRWDIQNIKASFPDIKIIYIMRDPVERVWSLLKYHEKRWQPGLSAKAMTDLVGEAFHPAKIEQSNYDVILKNWRSVFPESQFFTCYFDQITEEPERLARQLFDFLEISTSTSASSSGKINASSDKEMPAELRRMLIEYYRPMVQQLSDSEGGYFSKWLESYGTT